MSLYPLLLEPALHARVWGGRQLETILHKRLPQDAPYAEAWEVHDTAIIRNGAFAGHTISDLVKLYGHDLIGPDNDPAEGFPLLVKLIASADWASVQVHPNDEQARRLEGAPRGKAEAHFFLAAQPGAQVIIGVKPGTTPAELAQAIRDQTLPTRLVYADIAAGDTLDVPAGTIHATSGPSILLYEIQQSSDITYRLYDWGRLGLDGESRELHIEKGVAIANLQTLPAIKHTAGDASPVVEIVRNEYFTTLLHQLTPVNGAQIELDTTGRCFHTLTCIEGQARVTSTGTQVALQFGQTILIPASLGSYELSGIGRVLRSSQSNQH